MTLPNDKNTTRMQSHFPTTVRLPVDLKEALEAAAAENCRTVSGEVIHRLQSSFPQPRKAIVKGKK